MLFITTAADGRNLALKVRLPEFRIIAVSPSLREPFARGNFASIWVGDHATGNRSHIAGDVGPLEWPGTKGFRRTCGVL